MSSSSIVSRCQPNLFCQTTVPSWLWPPEQLVNRWEGKKDTSLSLSSWFRVLSQLSLFPLCFLSPQSTPFLQSPFQWLAPAVRDHDVLVTAGYSGKPTSHKARGQTSATIVLQLSLNRHTVITNQSPKRILKEEAKDFVKSSWKGDIALIHVHPSFSFSSISQFIWTNTHIHCWLSLRVFKTPWGFYRTQWWGGLVAF